jgi:hypothetical protein
MWMSESQTGIHGYQVGTFKTEQDKERIPCEKRAEDKGKVFILRLCILY